MSAEAQYLADRQSAAQSDSITQNDGGNVEFARAIGKAKADANARTAEVLSVYSR